MNSTIQLIVFSWMKYTDDVFESCNFGMNEGG